MGDAGMNGDIVWFVLQDDYIPYPSIDEVGAPWLCSALGPISGAQLGELMVMMMVPARPHVGENPDPGA